MTRELGFAFSGTSQNYSYSLKFLIVFVFWIWSGEISFSASFDCNGAKLEPEISICHDVELSDLDDTMAKQSRQTRALLNSKERQRFIREQNAFLSARTYCDAYKDCIKSVYRIRMNQLCKISQLKGKSCAKIWAVQAKTDRPQIGNCHMDVCSWFVARRRTKVDSNKIGQLYELEITSGTSVHYVVGEDAEQYPRTFSDWIPIDWGNSPFKYSVFCSKILPAVMSEVKKELSVSAFDFGGEGVAGALAFDASVYVYACHNLEPSKIYSDGFAKKLGYHALLENSESMLAKVKVPLDILEVSAEYAGSYDEEE